MNFSGIDSQTSVGKLLRLPLRLVPRTARVHIVAGPLKGWRWIVGSANHGYWLGSFEHEKQKAFCAAIKKGQTVYDLGANVGFYSLLASARVGTQGHVFSFEPVPRNLEFLRKHLELNGVTNCTVWEAAVGSSEGEASFDFGGGPSQGHLTSSDNAALRVKTVKLDDLVASGKLLPPDLIKCDIEGAEFEALKGASKILDQYGPTIFLATHGAEVHQRCCAFLKDLRYRLTSVDGLPLEETNEVLAIRE